MREKTPSTAPDDTHPRLESGSRRIALLICGWCNVALGVIGTVVPGMPTTVFLIIALWAFTRSSPRLRCWLYEHPRYGPALRDWDRHGVIPPRAKRLAAAMMAVSLVVAAALANGWVLPLAVGAVMAMVMLFIATRPSQPSPITPAKG
jgi:uncharacterized membrane protein YbaN (DUF454 family)